MADSRMRIMLATDDSASARTAEEWVTRHRYGKPPIIDVVCVAGQGIARLGWGMQTHREPVHLDCSEELLTMAGVGRPDLLVVGPRGRSGLAAVILGWVGIETIVIVAGYLAATAWIHRSRRTGRHERDGSGEVIAPTGWGAETSTGVPFRGVVRSFALAAGVVLVAAPFVALPAAGIADQTGVGQTFVGTFLLAVTTSLPELVASLTAVRIGAYDLAVANLFGSNAFNMVALFAADFAYFPGPLLAAVAPAVWLWMS